MEETEVLKLRAIFKAAWSDFITMVLLSMCIIKEIAVVCTVNKAIFKWIKCWTKFDNKTNNIQMYSFISPHIKCEPWCRGFKVWIKYFYLSSVCKQFVKMKLFELSVSACSLAHWVWFFGIPALWSAVCAQGYWLLM